MLFLQFPTHEHHKTAPRTPPVHVPAADESAYALSNSSSPTSFPEMPASGSSLSSGRRPKVQYAKTLRLTSEQLASILYLF
jgi:hypothetical protein